MDSDSSEYNNKNPETFLEESKKILQTINEIQTKPKQFIHNQTDNVIDSINAKRTSITKEINTLHSKFETETKNYESKLLKTLKSGTNKNDGDQLEARTLWTTSLLTKELFKKISDHQLEELRDINDYYDRQIKELADYETKCIKSIKGNIESQGARLTWIVKELGDYENLLKSLSSDQRNWKLIQQKAEMNLEEAQTIVDDFKSAILLNTCYKYNPNQLVTQTNSNG
jgi:hypothetical protein